MNRGGFGGVFFGQAKTGRVNQIDIVKADARIGDGFARRDLQRAAVGLHVAPVRRIGRCAEAEHFAVDIGTTCFGVFVVFQDQQAATFADDAAAALFVERSAGLFGAVVVIGDDAIIENGPHQSHRVHLAFGTAADAHVCSAAFDGAEGLTDGEMATRFAAGDRVRRCLTVVHDRYVTGEHEGHRRRQNQR